MTRKAAPGPVLEYMSITQAAAKWGRPRATVKVWCKRRQIPGVVKIGRQYAIPLDAVPPVLARGRPPKSA